MAGHDAVVHFADGSHVRDWLHVADHCRGIALALDQGRAGGVYHIGGGAEVSNKELTSMLLEATGQGWDMAAPGGNR
ncbi:NAD-dependent epimerase/dehydratase family protein [Streptomyces sp. 6N106]|uniref:NAD-dependent epimerase/dehydratase family protein n=1 Tax=Streptomyces sp. 6N106 TaxID=3457418 RepID=UPI000AFC2724